MELGYTSREGNAFNTLTIRHILENPKYKGWYCGNKSQSVDYRTKRNVLLDESEWVTYPDPSIPAIVSEDCGIGPMPCTREGEKKRSHTAAASAFTIAIPTAQKSIVRNTGLPFTGR